MTQFAQFHATASWPCSNPTDFAGIAHFPGYGRRVPKTVRQIEKIPHSHGWTCVRIVGSHRQWTHPDNPTW